MQPEDGAEGAAAMAGRTQRSAKQDPKQKAIVGRVMHEFKQGKLESSQGGKVRNPRQAIAIALHEAGASRDETPARNRKNLARTTSRMTRAELYAEAQRKEIPGRSRMGKEELLKALGK
jgi:hypothetical protein